MKAFSRFFIILLLLTLGILFPVSSYAAVNCPDVMPPEDFCPDGRSAVRAAGSCSWTCISPCESDSDCTTNEVCTNGTCAISLGLRMTPNQEVCLGTYNNPTIGTPYNTGNYGMIHIRYKTSTANGGVLERRSYWSSGTLGSVTSFTLPGSLVFTTRDIGSIPNSGWTGQGTVTLKIKNAGTNTLTITQLTVYGAFTGRIMGTYPSSSTCPGASSSSSAQSSSVSSSSSSRSSSSSVSSSSSSSRSSSSVSSRSSSSVAQAPTATPYPSGPPDKSQLFFKVKMPDVSTNVAVIPNVKVQVRDGGSVVAQTTVVLDRKTGTDFFKNSTPLILDVGGKQYTILIKQLKTIRRSFTVTLTKGQTVDCAKDSPDSACGSLGSPHLAPLLSGDADGFNDGSEGTTPSTSFNKINADDLQRIVSGYQAATLPSEPNADFNLDRKIDIFDLAILGKNYGKNGE